MSIFWLSLTFLLWGVVHSLLASLPAKALARSGSTGWGTISLLA
jgi:hypothetical protein